MRLLWYTLLALGGEYGDHVQAHVAHRFLSVALVLPSEGSAS